MFELWELFNQLLSHFFSMVLFPDTGTFFCFFPLTNGQISQSLKEVLLQSPKLYPVYFHYSTTLLCKISFLTSLSSDNCLLNSLPSLQAVFQFPVLWPETWLQVVSWSNLKAYLIFFFFQEFQSVLLIVFCLKVVNIHFLLNFSFLVIYSEMEKTEMFLISIRTSSTSNLWQFSCIF